MGIIVQVQTYKPSSPLMSFGIAIAGCPWEEQNLPETIKGLRASGKTIYPWLVTPLANTSRPVNLYQLCSTGLSFSCC